MNIYIGNLPYKLTDEQLRVAFGDFGEIQSCTIIRDKMTGASKGFGFIEMPEQDAAERAISAMNGREFQGKTLIVRDARGPRTG